MKLTHSQISEILSNYTSSSEGFVTLQSLIMNSLMYHERELFVSENAHEQCNGFLFLFCDGTTLLTNMVIGCFTEASHDFISDTAQVGCPHIVEDVRDTPFIFFPTVGYEERTRLFAVYHRRVGYGVGLVRVPIEHLLGSVVQASVCLLAMCSGAVGEAAVESVVFLLGHNILR